MLKTNHTHGPPVLRLQPLVLQVSQGVAVAWVAAYVAPMRLQHLWHIPCLIGKVGPQLRKMNAVLITPQLMTFPCGAQEAFP